VSNKRLSLPELGITPITAREVSDASPVERLAMAERHASVLREHRWFLMPLSVADEYIIALHKEVQRLRSEMGGAE